MNRGFFLLKMKGTMERIINNENDNNEIWFRHAEIEAALLTASLAAHFSESYALIQAKRAERAARAGEFRYPQIRKADNHRRRYRQGRKETHERGKQGVTARWMLV